MSLSERYLSRVAIAVKDAGLGEDQILSALKLVSWSIKQGRNLPWWRLHQDRILEVEGGWENVHASVMALTLGFVRNKDMSLADAALIAGDEWRADIRRQWDVGEGPVTEPTSVQGEGARIKARMGAQGRDVYWGDVEDMVLERRVRIEDPPPFDETTMTDPRLIQAWELASEKEREVLRLVAEGVTTQQAGYLLGGTESLSALRMRSLRNKIKAANEQAVGAAG